MAKIDVSTIEGYASMTAEQKLSALEGYEFDDKSQELERYKNAVSKANSEAATWKKKHNELLSEEERKKQVEAEELAALKEKLNTLEREKLIANHKASFLALGYGEELALSTAEALANQDTQTLISNQKAFIEAQRKAIKEDLYKNTPNPPSGKPTATTIDDLRKMSVSERYDFSVNHPEEYKQIYTDSN